MEEAAPQIGDEIGLQHLGSTPVTLPDNTQTHRNTWKLQTVDDLAHAQLENRPSRSGLKSSTLDYVNGFDIKSAIEFCERRGLASRQLVLRSVRNTIARQAKRLAGLVTRLKAVAPEVSRLSKWLIAPLVEADRNAAKLAHDRALISPKVAAAERDLQPAAAKLFRNPDATMAMLRQLLSEPLDAADQMGSRVQKDPESVAALRGSTGLMAGRAAPEERAAAIAAIPPPRRRIGDDRGMFGAMEAKERCIESERRERLGVGIPALSQEASSLLHGAAHEGDKAFAAALEQARKDAPEVMARLDGFQAALSKRLWQLSASS
ncbi:BID domain-containing protein [Roseobacter sp. A03A-229]